MTTTCQRCGVSFETEEFDIVGLKFIPKFCEPCGKLAEQEKDQREHTDRDSQAWEKICPVTFRLITEGGDTDLGRLLEEHPNLQEVLDARYCPKGLVIRGHSGAGKTRVVWRIIHREWNSAKTIKVYRAREFEADYRDAEGQHRLKKFLDANAKADLFFMDDMGKAGWSANTLETFFDIVEARTDNKKPIFITTQFDAKSLAEHLKLGRNMSDALYRRLAENCHCFIV